MNAIQIQGITADEFVRRIRDEIRDELCATPSTASAGNIDQEVLGTLIDRNYIKRNLHAGFKRIAYYESIGILRRQYNAADTKGVFYTLADFIRMREAEIARALGQKTF